MSELKCAIVVNENLPLGQIANAVAVLTLSIGSKHPELVGYDLVDQGGYIHTGITTVAIPVLKGGDNLRTMREALKSQEDVLTVVDVISATSRTRSYEEYADQMRSTQINDLNYYGVAIYGPKKCVNKFTGSLGLLR